MEGRAKLGSIDMHRRFHGWEEARLPTAEGENTRKVTESNDPNYQQTLYNCEGVKSLVESFRRSIFVAVYS